MDPNLKQKFNINLKESDKIFVKKTNDPERSQYYD